MSNYIKTIGIEVHVELKTKTKIFSFSRIKFLKKSAISATIYKSAIETQI